MWLSVGYLECLNMFKRLKNFKNFLKTLTHNLGLRRLKLKNAIIHTEKKNTFTLQIFGSICFSNKYGNDEPIVYKLYTL